MNEGLKAGIIGYGGAFGMGKIHAEQLAAAGIPTAAVCDLDAGRLEQATVDFPEVRTYGQIEDLLKDPEVGLCVVILPHNLHAPVAIQCARAKKHVIVEKPMCITVAEAGAMIEAARQAGVMLSVYHNRRWDGDYLAIRDLLARDVIGDAFHLEAAMGGYHAPRDWWRSHKEISGGAMHDWGAHVIDWILNLIPEKVAGVDGYFHKRHWHGMTNEDHAELIIRFEGGKITVEDIGSLNGTYVNRQPRLMPGNPVELKSGDEIIIGKTFLKLVVDPVS